MRLSWRLSLLMVLLTMLPALSAGWITRQLIEQSLDIGLNPQIDGALGAGVRRAREHLAIQREMLGRDLQDWVAAVNDTLAVDLDDPAAAVHLREHWANWRGPVLKPTDRLLLVADTGRQIVLHEGEMARQAPPDELRDGAPPYAIDVTAPLCAGWRAVARRPVTAGWREDAEILAGTLQVTRPAAQSCVTATGSDL